MKVLAGDIGGTKTLLGIYEKGPAGWIRHAEQNSPSRSAASLDDLVDAFVRAHPIPFEAACLGIAGPVQGNRVKATNLPWNVDGAEIARRINTPAISLINDFAAQTLGVLEIGADELVALNPDAAPLDAGAPAAAIGAGTGLGEAILARVGTRPVAISTEGGHCDFAPRNEIEIDLLRHLQKRFGRVSYERILSGPGLANVYRFLKESGAHPEDAALRDAIAGAPDPSPLISRAAIEDNDPLASRALELFVTIYGAEAGNLALRAIARGGVFVTGGIAAKILPRLRTGEFLRAFIDKGRLSSLVATFPVFVVLNPNTGLLGAAAEATRIAEG
ncbi:MAG: glucokinase [bacterium]